MVDSLNPDPGDDRFCACVEEGVADFIVTLNPRDFPQEMLKAHVIAGRRSTFSLTTHKPVSGRLLSS
jgi:hypothetical protein